MALKQAIDRIFYPNSADDWGHRAYRDFVLPYLTPETDLLDFGAGRGAKPMHRFRGLVRRVAGVDVDDAVYENPHVDEAKVFAPNGPIPYPDGSFDVVISAHVLEHVDDPVAVFREVSRVLRPGGMFVFQTPNALHYVPTMARLTPHAFHEWVNKRRGREDRDTFPTRYRANSPGRIRRLASETGFEVARLDLIEGRPEYLRAFPPLYPIGVAYERIVNSTEAFKAFRVSMLGALRKRR